MLRGLSRSTTAIATAILAVLVASTASAWASPCVDSCPMETKATNCCAGAHNQETTPRGTSDSPDEVGKPLPDCCEGGQFLGCANAAHLDPIAVDSQRAPAPAVATPPARLDWTALAEAKPLRALATAIPPPQQSSRTIVMLL